MSSVICNFNLFDFNQMVMVKNEDGSIENYSLSTEEFGKELANLCEAKDISDVYLNAPLEYATQKIIPEVDEYTSDKFSNNKINIRLKGV